MAKAPEFQPDVSMSLQQAPISRLTRLIHGALEGLRAPCDYRSVEQIAILVQEAMSLPAREFHDVDHVLEVADDGDPIEVLAALYHDVIYFHVDHCFAPRLEAHVSRFVTLNGENLKLRRSECVRDRWVQITLDIFGLSAGDRLHYKHGQNELLSAIVAAKSLESLLPEGDIAQIVACIEATIPFRGKDHRGRTKPEILAERLSVASAEHSLGLDEALVDQAVARSVNVANRDVGGFAETDPARFLVGTWRLYAESRTVRVGYLVKDYRGLLVAGLTFFESLDPAKVFRAYRGTPSPAHLTQMASRVRSNLKVAIEYLKVKLVGVALIEALAEVTGGDAPMAMFLGELARQNRRTERIEDHLPRADDETVEKKCRRSAVYRLLARGRAGESSFDTAESPVSAYMHDQLGEPEVLGLYASAEAMFKGKLTAAEYLAGLDDSVVAVVAEGCARIAWTRSERLRAIVPPPLGRAN